MTKTLRCATLLLGSLLTGATAWAQAVPGIFGWAHPRDAGLTSFQFNVNGVTKDIGLPATNAYETSLAPGDLVLVRACYGTDCYASATFTVPGVPPAPPPPPPPPPPPTGSLMFLGCFKDFSMHALPRKVIANDPALTLQKAVGAAKAVGDRYIGLNSGHTVWSAVAFKDAQLANPTECTTPLTGEPGVMAGTGEWRMTVYDVAFGSTPIPAGLTYKGPWKDGGAARALPNWVPMPGHYSTWGPTVCAAAARAMGYGPGDFIGLQAVQQCWAGKKGVDDPYRYGQPSPIGVSKTCRDGSGALCGGDWRNDVFELH